METALALSITACIAGLILVAFFVLIAVFLNNGGKQSDSVRLAEAPPSQEIQAAQTELSDMLPLSSQDSGAEAEAVSRAIVEDGCILAFLNSPQPPGLI